MAEKALTTEEVSKLPIVEVKALLYDEYLVLEKVQYNIKELSAILQLKQQAALITPELNTKKKST